MKIHIVSETQFLMQSTGVHTAFLDHVELLREKEDVEVVVNNDGTGDILHGHTYGLYYIWKGRKYKGRKVFTAHVIPDSIKGSLPGWRFLMPAITLGLRIIYSYADVCIAISPTVEKAIRNTGAKTKIVRIYNPVHTDNWKRDEEKRKKGRELLGLSQSDFVVIGIGQLIGRKGIDDFIDVAKMVPYAKFVWAGGRPFGKLSEGIHRINNNIKTASSNFSWKGEFSLEEMPLVYAAADAMLFPSYQENCPLAPVEAAASGIPVIFRDLEEYRFLYEHPYLKSSDNEGFRQIIHRLITDKEFYSEACSVSEQLITQFDKDVIRMKLINLYRNILEDSESSTVNSTHHKLLPYKKFILSHS